MSNAYHVNGQLLKALLMRWDSVVLPDSGEEMRQYSVVERGTDSTISRCLFLRVMDCVLSIPAFPEECLARTMHQIFHQLHPSVEFLSCVHYAMKSKNGHLEED